MGAVWDIFLSHKAKEDVMRYWYKRASNRTATISTDDYYRLYSAAKEVVAGMDESDIELLDDPRSIKEWNETGEKVGGGWKKAHLRRVLESSLCLPCSIQFLDI